MTQIPVIYADVCCLNRPLDDLQQSRVRFEKEQLQCILSVSTRFLCSQEVIESRAKTIMKQGFKFYDALHLAFAEAGEASVFLTTDDRLLRKAQQYKASVNLTVANPVIWLMNNLQENSDEIS